MDKMNTIIVIFCIASMDLFSGTYYVSEIVNGSCTFDFGECGWRVNGGNYMWKRHHGSTTHTSTGPDGDHTSKNGYYFYTISQSQSKKDEISDLQSVLIKSSPKQCLTFWYHMYGTHINTLKVFQVKNTTFFKLWEKSGTQGNKWHFQSLSLDDIGPYQIMFRAIRGNGYRSEIAVDDISINNTKYKKVDNTSKTSDDSCTIDTSDTSAVSDKSGTGDTSDTSATRDTNDTSDTSNTSDAIYTSDAIDTSDNNTVDTSDTSDARDTIDTSDTGMVVGLVIGGISLACIVIVIVVFIKRRTSKSRPREKIRNNLRENDYIGTQDIALPCLPLTANDSSYIQNDGKNTNTAYAVRRNIAVSDNPTLSDHKYSLAPETILNETRDDRKGTTDSYMVLDPSATGFNRTKLPNTYEFAKPVMDAENNIGDQDQYALSEEGVYDHSGNNRHKETEVNIYNHAVDTIYDSGSHKRNDEGRDDTYDHFFGQKTEDDYDISTTT